MEQLITFLTETPFLWQSVLIVITSFIGSAMTAAFSIGGGLLLIAVMSSVLPAYAIIPVHGAIMTGSNASRATLLREHIDWSIIRWFFLGAMIGAVFGSYMVTGLPAWAFRLAIAGFILFTQWGPKFKGVKPGPKTFAIAGMLSTILTLFVGASGPFITTIVSKVSHIARQGLIATTGACMTLQHSLKVGVFALAGFTFAPWLPLIILALISGFCGTFIGTRILKNIPETFFRKALKWLLTAMAFYLIFLALFSSGLF